MEHPSVVVTMIFRIQQLTSSANCDSADLYLAVEQHLGQVRTSNKHKYNADNPKTPSHTIISTPIQVDDASTLSAAPDTKDKCKCHKHKHMTFAAQVGRSPTSDNDKVQVMGLTQDFKECLEDGTPQALAREYRAVIDPFVNDCYRNRDYLMHNIWLQKWPMTLVMLFPYDQWKDDPLDKGIKNLPHYVLVLNFLGPHLDNNNQAYQTFLENKVQAKIEESIGQTANMRSKLLTKTFTGGAKETVNNVVCLIANFDAVMTFAMDDKGKGPPTIVTMFWKFANELTSLAFHKWVQKFIKLALLIPETLVTMLHAIYMQFAKVAKKTTNLQHLKADSEISHTVYKMCFNIFKKVTSKLQSAVNNSQLGVFKKPPT
eukprot:2764155-Ditylum_brightwellii.AAC.1